MNDRFRWEMPVTAALFTVAGLVGGWIAAGGLAPAATDEAAAVADHPPHLSAATLQNLGVKVGKVKVSSFFRTVSVAAVVTDTPTTEQPVFAPIGGRIESIQVVWGTVVKPGETVITLVRDPLPRPVLTLTSDVLRPAQERLHASVLELKKSAEEVRIGRIELKRVEKFTGMVGGRDLPIIPRQRAIDLRYQLSRAENAHQQARHELEKHGLSDAQVTAIEGGAPLPMFNEEMWQRALAGNGLWPPAAQQLNQALPARLRALPWVTATVGELAASGLATAELTTWVGTKGVAEHFLEIGVLLQRGHTLADLKRLHALNALQPVVRVQAPPLDAGGAWDVAALTIKPGAKVAAGDPLITLRDPRRLFLRTEPVGGEVASVLGAAEHGHSFAAKPLIKGSGPALQGLTIDFVASSKDNEGTIAYVELQNTLHPRPARQGQRSRTWQLREGMRYLLSVPVQKMDRVFVLPAAAVADDGPNKVVYLRDGDSFKPVPIVIAYQDHEIVVVPSSKDVMLFPGDAIAMSGAFALGLALRGSDAMDAHQGHSH